jgi:hypothetical protein
MFKQQNILFQKSGAEIRQAIQTRLQGLKERLDGRNAVLDEFIADPKKVRSYLVRSAKGNYSIHSGGTPILFAKEEISSEEKEEIHQLCTRIFEIEQEISQLKLISEHLKDDQILELSFDDLARFGFSVGTDMEIG